jgi:hypothetical protein
MRYRSKAKGNKALDKIKEDAKLLPEYNPENKNCFIYDELGELVDDLHIIISRDPFASKQQIKNLITKKSREIHKSRIIKL